MLPNPFSVYIIISVSYICKWCSFNHVKIFSTVNILGIYLFIKLHFYICMENPVYKVYLGMANKVCLCKAPSYLLLFIINIFFVYFLIEISLFDMYWR